MGPQGKAEAQAQDERRCIYIVHLDHLAIRNGFHDSETKKVPRFASELASNSCSCLGRRCTLASSFSFT